MASTPGAARTVLVGGHESAGSAELEPLLEALPGAVATPVGRPLHAAVVELLSAGDGPVTVLPMTWGRDPTMVADAAKALAWVASGPGAGRVALCGSLGTIDHLVAWLRRAATQVAVRGPGTGMVVAAHAANPFDDAELHRVAHLVRTHGSVAQVEVACYQDGADLAGFARAEPAGLAAVEHTSWFGPLVSRQGLLHVVGQRVDAALHDLSHGHDGIAVGLQADHGHGYAHSHAFEEGGEGHPHPHAHSHAHPHPHTQAHTHVHTDEAHETSAPDASHHEALASHH